MKNKKILIGSIFAVLLMLSMPVISNIQAQPALETDNSARAENNIIDSKKSNPLPDDDDNATICLFANILVGTAGVRCLIKFFAIYGYLMVGRAFSIIHTLIGVWWAGGGWTIGPLLSHEFGEWLLDHYKCPDITIDPEGSLKGCSLCAGL